MRLVSNLVLYVAVALPGVALFSFLGELVWGGPEGYEVGANPILWLVFTVPWNLPGIVTVPALEGAARLAKRRSWNPRVVVLILAPVLIGAVYGALWGASIRELTLALPVILGALAYGALFRLPEDRAAETLALSPQSD